MFFEKLSTVARTQPKWEGLYDTRTLTIRRKTIISPTDKVFTIGSCFAEEIRKAMTARGMACLPSYRDVAVDLSRMRVDNLPRREHMNYYNTFSIRQELERAAGLWTQDRQDVWQIQNRQIQDGNVATGEGEVYQDPYRRLVFGRTLDDLWEALDQVNDVMARGIREADAAFITLGMTEVFRKRNNGLICNQVPTYVGGAGLRESYFHASTFQENYENVRATIRLFRQLNPDIRLVVTVSPVPLHRTFSGEDIYVANMLSKSTLRAVAGEICREFEDVTYFPSYEIVSGFGSVAFREGDLLHVREDVAALIVSTFLQAHSSATAERAEAGAAR